MKITYDNAKTVLLVLGVAYVGYKTYKASQRVNDLVEEAGEIISEDLNPASDENLIYRGTQAAGKAIGSTLSEWVN